MQFNRSKTLKKTMSTFNNRVGKNIYPIIQKYLKNLFTYKNMYTFLFLKH